MRLSYIGALEATRGQASDQDIVLLLSDKESYAKAKDRERLRDEHMPTLLSSSETNEPITWQRAGPQDRERRISTGLLPLLTVSTGKQTVLPFPN